jgi:plastocyanin
MINRITLVAAVMLAGSVHALAGGDDAVVIVKDFKFTPQHITVRRGQTVIWENREKRQFHSVWFEALGEDAPDYIFADETYQRSFPDTGNFPYRCGPHPEMTGSVTVIE